MNNSLLFLDIFLNQQYSVSSFVHHYFTLYNKILDYVHACVCVCVCVCVYIRGVTIHSFSRCINYKPLRCINLKTWIFISWMVISIAILFINDSRSSPEQCTDGTRRLTSNARRKRLNMHVFLFCSIMAHIVWYSETQTEQRYEFAADADIYDEILLLVM